MTGREHHCPVRVLLVEDDLRLASLIDDYLQQEHFQVRVEHRGDSALERFDAESVDIVILDLMLPGVNGLEVCSQLRQQFEGPILILTARNSDIDHVMGLELGADDFVNKPVEPQVLLARIRALLRRSRQGTYAAETASREELVFDSLRINIKSHKTTLGMREIALTTQEFELLAFLARHAGTVLTRDDIYSNIRGIAYDGLDRTVDVRISHLRRKLGDSPEQPRRIKTVWGKGYLFAPDEWTDS